MDDKLISSFEGSKRVLDQKSDNWVALSIWVLLMCIPIQGLIGAVVVQVVGALAFTLAIIHTLRTQRIRRFDISDALALAFACWGIASFFWARNEQISLRALTTQFQLVVFLFLLRSIITSSERVLFLMEGYIIGALVVAINVINAYLRGHNVVNRYTAGNMNAGFVGGVLALGISPAILLLMCAPRRSGRVLGLLYLPTAALAIILTGTRTSAIAALVSVLIFAGANLLGRSRHRRMALLVILLLAMGVGIVFVYFPNIAGIVRLAKIHEAVVTRQLAGREYIWPVAINTFLQHPLIGIGIGSFSLITENVLGYKIVAHNTWLSVAAELGLVGLIIFCSMNIFMVLSFMRTKGLMQLFGCSLVAAWFINASMGTDTYSKTTWMVYALVSALPKIPRFYIKQEKNIDHL